MTPPAMGHRDLDREHRHLANAAAGLQFALLGDERDADIELRLHELVDQLLRHLRHEWSAMKRLGVRPSRAAYEFHRDARARAEALLAERDRAALPLEDLVKRVIDELVVVHLRAEHAALPTLQESLQRLKAKEDAVRAAGASAAGPRPAG